MTSTTPTVGADIRVRDAFVNDGGHTVALMHGRTLTVHRLGTQPIAPKPYQQGLPLPEPQAGKPVGREHPAPPSGAASAAIHVSGFTRQNRDFYATPAWVTETLLRHLRLCGPVWEPCCGDGAMSRVLAAAGHAVVSTDIADRGYGTAGVDFLACSALPQGCRAIVTNPPYGETGTRTGEARSAPALLRFAEHALGLTAAAQGQLALLVRLNWIAGRRASAMLSAAPFAATIVLTKRIRWFDMGEATNNSQHHHAWVVIDHAHPPDTPPALLFA